MVGATAESADETFAGSANWTDGIVPGRLWWQQTSDTPRHRTYNFFPCARFPAPSLESFDGRIIKAVEFSRFFYQYACNKPSFWVDYHAKLPGSLMAVYPLGIRISGWWMLDGVGCRCCSTVPKYDYLPAGCNAEEIHDVAMPSAFSLEATPKNGKNSSAITNHAFATRRDDLGICEVIVPAGGRTVRGPLRWPCLVW